MGVLGVIQLALTLLSGVLPLFVKSGAPAELIASLQTAINEISKVHSTLVTKAQVDQLLIDPKW